MSVLSFFGLGVPSSLLMADEPAASQTADNPATDKSAADTATSPAAPDASDSTKTSAGTSEQKLPEASPNQEPLEPPKKRSLLAESGLCSEPSQMLLNWLLSEIDARQADWISRYETLKTPEEIQAYQQERIAFFWKQLGPLWEKTPLNPQITGTLAKDGYRIEKLLFESVPGFYVSGTMFLPEEDRFSPPYPAILFVCGHSVIGKANPSYQRFCEFAAYYGLAVLAIDPIDQGERMQHQAADGSVKYSCVPAHNIIGGGSLLLGRNTATFEVWDMTRALDYLETRPDILPGQFGVAGNSGGGTQTSYIMALDPRVSVAGVSCYLCNLFDDLPHHLGVQDAEQNIFGQLGFGMDHADYPIMRAPRPTLMCVGTQDFFNIDDAWETFRYAKRIYSRFNAAEKMLITETDLPHNFEENHRTTTVRWMLRWLADRDEQIVEPTDLPDLTQDEIRSLSSETTVFSLPGARTTFDLNRDLAAQWQKPRRERWASISSEDAAALVRQTAGIRPLEAIPQAIRHDLSPREPNNYLLESDPGIYLPVHQNRSFDSAQSGSNNSDEITLMISDQGRDSQRVQSFLESVPFGVTVDLRGWGETQGHGQNYYSFDDFGPDGSQYYLAYLLGRSYVGMRTEDLLATARYLQEQNEGAKLHLVAEGLAGIVALHAFIAAPGLFESLEIDRNAIPTWTSLIEASPTMIPLSSTIHGVLEFYDIDDLLQFVDRQ